MRRKFLKGQLALLLSVAMVFCLPEVANASSLENALSEELSQEELETGQNEDSRSSETVDVTTISDDEVTENVIEVSMLDGMESAVGRVNPVNPTYNTTTDRCTYDCVYFGEYPQSEVSGNELTDDIINASYTEENDYTATVNGERYRRVSRDMAIYTIFWGSNRYRYFKYEPIQWRVLKNDGTNLFLVAEKLLDLNRFNIYFISTSWKDSIMRSFLASTFCNRAFDNEQKNAICTQTIEGTLGSEDTSDKVYLLSYDDTHNMNYGFCPDADRKSPSRRSQCTPYARAISSETWVYSMWWLRTPACCGGEQMSVLSDGYTMTGYHGVDRYFGVRPALTIPLSSSIWSNAPGSDGNTPEVKTTHVVSNNKVTDMKQLIKDYPESLNYNGSDNFLQNIHDAVNTFNDNYPQGLDFWASFKYGLTDGSTILLHSFTETIMGATGKNMSESQTMYGEMQDEVMQDLLIEVCQNNKILRKVYDKSKDEFRISKDCANMYIEGTNDGYNTVLKYLEHALACRQFNPNRQQLYLQIKKYKDESKKIKDIFKKVGVAIDLGGLLMDIYECQSVKMDVVNIMYENLGTSETKNAVRRLRASLQNGCYTIIYRYIEEKVFDKIALDDHLLSFVGGDAAIFIGKLCVKGIALLMPTVSADEVVKTLIRYSNCIMLESAVKSQILKFQQYKANDQWPDDFDQEVEDFEILYNVYLTSLGQVVDKCEGMADKANMAKTTKTLRNAQKELKAYSYDTYCKMAMNKANNYYSSSFEYVVKNGKVVLLAGGGGFRTNEYSVGSDEEEEMEFLVIPSEIDGYPVTEIEQDAFTDNSGDVVIIPSDIERIGNGSFSNSNMINIIFGGNVETIGEGAFRECSNLEEVILPEHVEEIEAGAFSDNDSLSSVVITGINTLCGTDTFQNCPQLELNTLSNSEAATYASANGISTNPISATVSSIETATMPNTTSVRSDGEIDTTGLTLRVTYSDGTTENVQSGWLKGLSTDGSGVNIIYADQMVHYNATITPCEQSYTVQYVDENGSKLKDDKIGQAVFGTQVTENPVSIFGYTCTNPNEMLTIDLDENILTYQYQDIRTSISGANIELMNSDFFIREQNPELRITMSGNTLVKNQDYTVSVEKLDGIHGKILIFGINQFKEMTAIDADLSCKITFESSGGNQIEQQSVSINSLISTIPLPVREGYTFDGWYKERELSTKWNFDSDQVTDNTTLYAKWKKIEYPCEVQFDSNGGNIVAPITISKNALIENAPTPIRDGYSFEGWYKEQELITRWNFEIDQVIENITLYAKWEKLYSYNEQICVIKQKVDVSKCFNTTETIKRYKVFPSKNATISSKGIVTAKKAGEVTVKAYKKVGSRYEQVGEDYKLTIEKPKLNKMNATKVGEDIRLLDQVQGSTNHPTKWLTSKASIASIDETIGLIMAHKNGTVKITAYFGEGKNAAKYSTTLTVKIPRLSLSKLKLRVGKTKKIKVVNTKLKPTAWKSSDEAIATVDESGKIKAVAKGTTTISATVDGVDYGCEVNVR